MLHNGPSRRRRLLTRILRIESLEHRTLLAADITFGEPVTYQVGAPVWQQATFADANLDGKVDIVAGTPTKVLVGKGDGTFETPMRTRLASPWMTIAGDFDGDGYVDLASSGESPGVLRIALNQGATDAEWAGFGRAEIVSTYPTRFGGLTTGDLDADGDLDIVVGTATNRIVVFLNNGTPGEQWDGFAEPVEYIRNRNFNSPYEVTTGDMDNDGDLDLLVSNYFGGDVSILLGTGDGQFSDPVNYPVGSQGLERLGVGDLDGDGNLDIVAPHYFDESTNAFSGTDHIALLRGQGDGTLAPVESIRAPGTVRTLVTEDLDADGDLDVAAGFQEGRVIHLLANNGDATFEEQDSLPSVFRIQNLVAADLDGNGQMDLVASNGHFEQTLSVHLNTTELPSPTIPGDSNGDGVFNSSDLILVFQAGEYEDKIAGNSTFAEGDWNGDGDFTTADLVFAFQAGTYAAEAHRGSPHGGGGKTTQTAQSATMVFTGGLNVKDDDFTDINGDVGVYTDGLDRVMAQVGDGSRLDTTNGSMKVIDNNMIRTVVFDMTNFTLVQGEEISTLPDDGDGDTTVIAGVDARVQYETDMDGNNLGTKPGLTSMAPGDGAYAAFFFSFGFLNGDGVEERWQLAYAQVGGLSSPVGYGLPVFITAGADTTGDGLADSWTIVGTKAGLTQIKVGNKEDPKYFGEAEMSFEITVEVQ